MAWFAQNRRDLPWRRTKDPYAIWVSEVMLQQTQVKTVDAFYRRFMEQFPDIQHLAGAPLQDVLKAWEGLGYYSRARNLYRAAGIVHKKGNGRIPSEWYALHALPGIGDYIAAAVLSIAFKQPYAVVDGNVKRVLARLFRIPTPVNETSAHRIFQKTADLLLDTARPGDFNQAVMELGALVCTPRQPRCSHCPLSRYCQAFRTDTVSGYPQRAKRRSLPQQRWVAGVICKRNRILLTRRPSTGLLGGLWEFPAGPVSDQNDTAEACVSMIRSAVHLDVAVRHHVITVRHTYTHFKLQMAVFLCDWHDGRVRLSGPEAFRWIGLRQLENYPLHGAVHKALGEVRRALI